MEDKVYYRHVGGHSQRQGHLGEFRVDLTRLSWVLWERRREKGEKRTRCVSQEVKGTREQGILYYRGNSGGGGEQPNPWAESSG